MNNEAQLAVVDIQRLVRQMFFIRAYPCKSVANRIALIEPPPC